METLLIFKANSTNYGIAVSEIGQILPLSQINDFPMKAKGIIGSVKVRGYSIPLYDFRTITGHLTLMEERQELVKLLNQREQDHIDWLEALIVSVKSNTEFRKALNPRACAFGKWFYSYTAPDVNIDRVLKQFEEPHNAIHALGEKVLNLLSQKKVDEALQLIEKSKRTTLHSLLKLFDELKRELTSNLRNLFFLMRASDGTEYALCVDAVENVRAVGEENMNLCSENGVLKLIKNTWSNNEQTIYEVNTEYLNMLILKNQISNGLNAL